MAYNLKIPIEEVENMDFSTFNNWKNYFEMRPIGWQEDYRLYMYLRSQGLKERPEEVFPSIRAVMSHKPERTQGEALKGSSFLAFLKMSAAKNNSDWKIDED